MHINKYKLKRIIGGNMKEKKKLKSRDWIAVDAWLRSGAGPHKDQDQKKELPRKRKYKRSEEEE